MVKLNQKNIVNLVNGLQSQFPESQVTVDFQIGYKETGKVEDKFPTFIAVKKTIIIISEPIIEVKKEDYV